MAASSYDDALRRVLAHEGGYTDHPSDPGGPTNFGITIHDYRKYRKPDATAADVKAMRLADAKAIYRAKYWDAMRCGELPAGVDYAVFDYGVNSGIGRAPKVLQRVVGVPDDGRIGPVTLAAVRARDPKKVVAAICDERLAFLQRLKTWPVFGKGWGRRVAEVRAMALAMVDRQPIAAAAQPAPGKGAVPVNKAAQNGSAGGVVATGGTAATQAGDPSLIVVIVVVTVAAALGAWLFWRWWQRWQQEAPVSDIVPRTRCSTQ